MTNTGPTVLNGDLGVSPGTALTGFGLPAVVNGATHANDAVAAQAQLDSLTAFNVAAGEPVAPGSVLTGTDLGSRTLTAGAYRYDTSAQLTGALTLDAAGDPNAQFVFQIGSTLTTASASSIVLANGAQSCNIFWQVGTSATLGTGAAFQGNILASSSITLNTGATLVGRALAQNGAVTLDTNTVTAAPCAAPQIPVPPVTPPGGTPPGVTPPGAVGGTAPATAPSDGAGAGAPVPTLRRVGGTCVDPFRARVRGNSIASVVYRLDGKRIATRRRAPFTVLIDAGTGRHRLTALVTFSDGTPQRLLTRRYRRCAEVVLQPRRGPSVFTG